VIDPMSRGMIILLRLHLLHSLSAVVDPEVACCESLCNNQPVCGMGCRARTLPGSDENQCEGLSQMYAEHKQFLYGCTHYSRCSCPAGFQANTDGSCIRCSLGFYCPGPGMKRMPCPAGTVGSGGASTAACSGACISKAGFFALPAATSFSRCAARCPRGKFSIVQSLNCQLCAVGRYTSHRGNVIDFLSSLGCLIF
jgi:hypothetical protein